MSDIAIVQLSRYGDIVNVLPLALHWHREGKSIDWIVGERFADILEAVSYVTPRIWKGEGSDVVGAERFATNYGPHRIVTTQVDGNPRTKRTAPNFTVESWLHAGMAQHYHSPQMRLVFDRRDEMGESLAALAGLQDPDGFRPILAYSLTSHSSPFPGAADFEAWLIETFGAEYRLLNLGKLKLPKVHHLLGPIRVAETLITVDSLPLHLSFATHTPTIALSREELWSQSEQRAHWLGRLTYGELAGDEAKAQIIRMVEDRAAVKRSTRRLIQAVDWFEPKDRPTLKRMNRARHTWETMSSFDSFWDIATHRLQPGSRSSKDLGDTRSCPYLKDVIYNARKRACSTDIIVLTNADSCLPPEAPTAIRKAMVKHDCAFSHRIDIQNWRPYSSLEFAGRQPFCGFDLFAFKADWWDRNRERMPDMLLAYEGWDFILMSLMKMTGGIKIEPPIVYHEVHEAQWSKHDTILSNPGQIYNRRLATEFAIANGLERFFNKKGNALFASTLEPEYAM